MTEIQKLHLRWHKKTGEDMPIEIANQPIERIRRAVDFVEAGAVVVIPPHRQAVEADVTGESSLRYWDEESNN